MIRALASKHVESTKVCQLLKTKSDPCLPEKAALNTRTTLGIPKISYLQQSSGLNWFGLAM